MITGGIIKPSTYLQNPDTLVPDNLEVSYEQEIDFRDHLNGGDSVFRLRSAI